MSKRAMHHSGIARPDQVGLISDTPLTFDSITRAEIRATYLTYDEMSALVGVSKSKLRRMIDNGSVPEPVQFDREDRFPRWAINRWLHEQGHGHAVAA